jgi:hypothetical protein
MDLGRFGIWTFEPGRSAMPQWRQLAEALLPQPAVAR